MGLIGGHLNLITELKNKTTSFFKNHFDTHGLTKKTEEVLSLGFRFGGTKRQRRKLKVRKELPIVVRDIGEASPKLQQTKSNKDASEEAGKVDEWLTRTFSNGQLNTIQDDPKAAKLEDYTVNEVSKNVPFSLNESRSDLSTGILSLPYFFSDTENTMVGYFDPMQIQSTFDLQGSLIEQLQEFKYCKIIPLNDIGFFAFKFRTEDQQTLVLEHGQLFINNKPLILKKWSPKIVLVPTHFLSALPIWVRFYNLNWAYWSQECLSRISSIIGNPLFMDKCTATMARLNYARVCVEVNTDVLQLPDIVHMLRDGKIIPIPVEYEWKPEQCGFCLSIYHDLDACEFLGGGASIFSAEKLKLHQDKETQGAYLKSSYDDGCVETISVSSGPEYEESFVEESMDDAQQERITFVK